MRDREKERKSEKESTVRSGRPITANLLAFAGSRVSLFLFISVFSLILYFLPVSSIVIRMPMEEQREKPTATRRNRGGNVLLAVTFDHGSFSKHSLYKNGCQFIIM